MNDSERDPEQPQSSGVALSFAASVFYGLFVFAAVMWFWLRDRSDRLPELALGEHGILWALGVGLSAGLALSGMMVLLGRYVKAFARLEARLTEAVGDLSEAEILLLAMASSIGEEMLFRGAIQDHFGLIVAALVFGCFHIGPGMWLWTVIATLLGLLFGAMVHFGFGLLSATLAHAVVNFISLRRMTA